MYKTSKTCLYAYFPLKTSCPDLCSNLMHLILGEIQMEELKTFFKSSRILKYTFANARQGLAERTLISLYPPLSGADRPQPGAATDAGACPVRGALELNLEMIFKGVVI